MNFHLHSFFAGALTFAIIQLLLMIPLMRRHRMVSALLDRAKIYQQRAVAFSEVGNETDAEKAWRECNLLLEQIKKLTGAEK